MKPKSVHGARGRPPKHKAFKKEMEIHEDLPESDAKPSVDIVSCISYQKFRYSGENRPGKKYQEKDFMELKLTNLGDKLVRIVIICTDAENKELIHPNGLVGKDCHDGIYDKEYAVLPPNFNIKIPYLRTERIKTKKNEHVKIRTILQSRAAHLPSPYRERCESQCTDQYTFNRKFDTTKVCLGVIVTVKSHFSGAVNGSLHAISHVVHNASEKTSLGILKISHFQFSASKGGLVDIFTTEEGPIIEHDKYYIYVSYENEDGINWESEKFVPRKEDILYKRIITYTVPPFDRNLELKGPIEAVLHLDCPQSNQSCECMILYSPHEEEFVFYETQNLKRSFTEDLDDMKPPKQMRLDNSVKAVLKESLKKRDKNSSAPSMQIIQTSHEAALVRRTEPQSVLEEIDHTSHRVEHSSHSHEEQAEDTYQNLKILAAGYSNSVPSDTVLIVANDGVIPEDIENAISKASYHIKHTTKDGQEVIFVDSSHDMSSHQTISLESSPREVFIVPDSRSSDHDTKVKEQSNDMPSPAKVQMLQKQNENNSQSAPSKIIPTSVASKKIPKTDSPWSVGYDDEIDLNLFHEFSFDKQPAVTGKHQTNHQGRSSQISYMPSNTNELSKSAPVEQQKTITILSNKGKVINKETESYGATANHGENSNLDFSEVPLPSDRYLNSEYISKYAFVKDVSKDFH